MLLEGKGILFLDKGVEGGFRTEKDSYIFEACFPFQGERSCIFLMLLEGRGFLFLDKGVEGGLRTTEKDSYF
jgi:hypothetical protein